MTDLIARLTEKVSARRDYYERNMRHLGFVQTVEFTLEDAEACLHALKVTKAAEAWEPLYQTVTYGEPKFADHKEFEQAERALAAAVKGEQG